MPAFPPPTTYPQTQDFTITLLPWSAETAQACLSLSLPFPEVPAPWSPEQKTSRMSHPHGGLGTTTSGWFRNNAGFVSEMPESQKERLLILFINLLTPKDKFVLSISLLGGTNQQASWSRQQFTVLQPFYSKCGAQTLVRNSELQAHTRPSEIKIGMLMRSPNGLYPHESEKHTGLDLC